MLCKKCNTKNDPEAAFCYKCGAELSSEREPFTHTMQELKLELTTGSTFAERYQVIEELGHGGMGRVYKVLDTELNEKVALKLLKPEIAADEKTIGRFRNELKLARTVSHKNVCRMYHMGKWEGNYYITMEYVSGEDLKSMIRMMERVGSGKAISVAKQVCEGLVEAHSLGVIHRDLKPQNIMIDKEGNARIMDFGIARSLSAKGLTAAGVMIGTPEYMSPEQAEAKDVDHRSDIYAMGVILYEMVTGQLPFSGDTHLSIAMKHKGEIPQDPKEINPQISESLNLLILKCLEKQKGDRYQFVSELLKDLKLMEQGLPTTEKLVPKRKPSTSREITVTVGLKKLWIPALVIGLVVIAIVLWQVIPKKATLPAKSDKPSLAILYFENGTGDAAFDHWRRGLSSLLIADLQQSKYVDVLSPDRIFSILRELDLAEAQSYATEDLREVAQRGGSSHILQGILTKAGENFRINVTLQDADSGELLASEEVEGMGEESFHPMVDELTKKIKTSLDLSENDILMDIDREVQNITTSSPEAYKYYIEARKFHMIFDNENSILLLEKAIEIDPEFAMAYRSMAMSYYNSGRLDKRQEYMQKAIEFGDRLSDRERYLIEGDYYNNSEDTYNKAIAAYEKIIALYPNETSSNHNLANMYTELEDVDKAIMYYSSAVQNKSAFINTYESLATLYNSQGKYNKAMETLNLYIKYYPDHPGVHRGFAEINCLQDQNKQALSEMDKAFALDPADFLNHHWRAAIYRYTQELEKSEAEYSKLLGRAEPMAGYWAANGLVDLYLLQGRYKEAAAILNKAVENARSIQMKWAESEWSSLLAYVQQLLDQEELSLRAAEDAEAAGIECQQASLIRPAIFMKGLALIKAEQMQKALQVADELKSNIEAGLNPKSIRYYDFLQGLIEQKKGNWPAAIELMEKAANNRRVGNFYLGFIMVQIQHVWHVYTLANAYYQTGDFNKAMALCEQKLRDRLDIIGYSDSRAKLNYLMGKIYQELGQKQKAVDYYRQFLKLWENADPGLPELTDAQARLKELSN